MNDKLGRNRSDTTAAKIRRRVPALGACLWVALALSPAALAADSERIGVLTLINDGQIQGLLGESDSSELIVWHGSEFTQPFRLRTAAVKSIKFPVPGDGQAARAGFAFEFHSGDVVSGQLVDWSPESIKIRSDQFGDVAVRPAAIRRLHRIERNARSVFASLSGLHDWSTTAWDTSGWQEDGEHLETSQPGAALNGDLSVPERAVVEFKVSWEGKPDFVFAIGVDADGGADTYTDGWRFETVDGSLAIVRQRQDSADVDLIADLRERQSIRLNAFVDQRAGKMQILLADGTLAGEIVEPPSESASAWRHGRGVRLVNRGGNLRLQRLRIARWLADEPSLSNDGQTSVVMADGVILSGSIDGFDSKAGQLLIGDGDRQASVELQDVIAIKLAASIASDPLAQCALFLQDGTRLSGDLNAIDSTSWIVSGSHLVDPVRIPRDRVRSMIVFRHDGVDLDPGLQLGRLGRLELGSRTLEGRLASATGGDGYPAGESMCLHWRPLGSDNAAPLKRMASGSIVYQEKPKLLSSTAARMLALQRLRLQQQKRGLNFGKLFLERIDNAAYQAVKRDAHVIHIRSGDVVACRIESIDESGVRLSTVDSDDGFVPHDQVKAIELVDNSPPPDLNDAKRQRLLTIPRLQKSSPPTHLIRSHSGDYLRCRLLRVDDESVVIEVQLEEITIPRERVAQIIWFHEDELPAVDDSEQQADGVAEVDADAERAGQSYHGVAQVLKSDGKRVTFVPTEVTEKTIAGESELLGECRFDLFKVDQLILGDRIALEVADVAFNRWKLQHAVEPLAMQGSVDGPNVGSGSPLIGLEAPELRLQLLAGGQFNLEELRGRVVVLDFWASWCAPCMQTMPLLEQAIDQFDADQVNLISINLEEPAEHIRSVLDRHQLNLTVALDLDGVAAAKYQARAIPQLVIIDPEGKVDRLYVGGGEGVIEQMKAAIADLLE